MQHRRTPTFIAIVLSALGTVALGFNGYSLGVFGAQGDYNPSRSTRDTHSIAWRGSFEDCNGIVAVLMVRWFNIGSRPVRRCLPFDNRTHKPQVKPALQVSLARYSVLASACVGSHARGELHWTCSNTCRESRKSQTVGKSGGNISTARELRHRICKSSLGTPHLVWEIKTVFLHGSHSRYRSVWPRHWDRRGPQKHRCARTPCSSGILGKIFRRQELDFRYVKVRSELESTGVSYRNAFPMWNSGRS